MRMEERADVREISKAEMGGEERELLRIPFVLYRYRAHRWGTQSWT